MAVDEAIVLVGGFGTRLRALVPDLPKPLAPVAGRPFLAWLLDALVEGGMAKIVLATGYGADQIREVVGDRWGSASVEYSHEEVPLGTGGALRQALSSTSGAGVHLVNGDTYLRYSPLALEMRAQTLGVDAAVALADVPDVGRYGSVEVVDGLVRAFSEKGGQGSGLINAGCYFLGPGAIRDLPRSEAFSFEHLVLPAMARDGRMAGCADTSGFIDIGVPEDYARAQTWFPA